MPLIFSYGTLQQEDVQLSNFGRPLQGQRDELPEFEAATSGRHANVTFNGSSRSRVAGMAFEITDAELAAADRYEELAAYTRIAVTLASGKQAWVYVDASITLRTAVLADATSIASLVTQLGYPVEAGAMKSRLDGMLALSHHSVVVAETAGAVVGVGSASVDRGFQADGLLGRITALAVDERCRGRGIGKRLMQRMEQWCRERGATRMTVTSGNQRADAHKFYGGIGYEATGLRFIKRL